MLPYLLGAYSQNISVDNLDGIPVINVQNQKP